jgi:hypothetical protein
LTEAQLSGLADPLCYSADYSSAARIALENFHLPADTAQPGIRFGGQFIRLHFKEKTLPDRQKRRQKIERFYIMSGFN